jgi:sulfoxide reductase heme-binding subunit YedZ
MSNTVLRFVLKPTVFIASLVPAAWLAWAGISGNLSANPLSDITNETGLWTLRFLCLTLAVTPLRRVTGWNSVIRFRRMLGLFAFFYGCLHFLIYTIADRFAGLDFPDGIVAWSTVVNLLASIWDDIYKRPYITVGFTAFVLMIPLAITSTAGMIRRLGGKRWNTLHRLIYISGIGGALHYLWLVKADIRSPLMYWAILAVLLLPRVYWARSRSTAGAARGAARPRPVAIKSKELSTQSPQRPPS